MQVWKDSRISEVLVGAVGIEPTTFGLKVCVSLLQLFGINNLTSRYLVELRLFGLFRAVLRTFSVLAEDHQLDSMVAGSS